MTGNNSLLSCCSLLAASVVVGVIGLFCIRLLGLSIVNTSFDEVTFFELASLMWMGVRFDVTTISRLCLIPILFTLPIIILPSLIKRIYITFFHGYVAVAMFLFIASSIGNLVHLSFFGNAFDVFVFESLSFGWKIIFSNVLGAGATILLPLFLGLFVTALSVYGVFKLAHYIDTFIAPNILLWKQLLLLLGFALGVLIVGRGSLGVFPLSIMHSSVTSSQELNELALNGLYRLYEEGKNFYSSEAFEPAVDAEGRRVFEQYFGKKAAASPVFGQFFTRTKFNQTLEEKPPHVVLFVTEGLSTALLDEQYTQSKQLGANLQKHFAKDGWFSRFTPAHNFTHGSIANLLTNLDFPTISQSRYSNIALSTSAVRGYKEKGYHTVYIYPGYESVREAAHYYTRQGFDTFVGAGVLSNKYSEMPINIWGGEDFYAVSYLKDLLTQSTKPLFVVVQTLTNHSPYKAPVLPWQDKPLLINETMRKVNGGLPDEALQTYHYTTEVLADFLDFVKQSTLADQTIVAITGDHAQRGVLTSQATEVFTKAVPFYLYVPPYLRSNNAIDWQTLGSHRDIMPTLYNLSLSNVRYLNVGNNLLQSQADDEQFAILHGKIITNAGLLIESAQAKKYRPKIKPFIADGWTLNARYAEINNTAAIDKAYAYRAVIDWLKRYQLQAKDK